MSYFMQTIDNVAQRIGRTFHGNKLTSKEARILPVAIRDHLPRLLQEIDERRAQRNKNSIGTLQESSRTGCSIVQVSDTVFAGRRRERAVRTPAMP